MTDLTRIKKGDRVRITETSGDVLEATITAAYLAALETSSHYVTVNNIAAVEVLPSTLPTEPGFYLDEQDDLWTITDPGAPLTYVSMSRGLDSNIAPASYAPFTRLTPTEAPA